MKGINKIIRSHPKKDVLRARVRTSKKKEESSRIKEKKAAKEKKNQG